MRTFQIVEGDVRAKLPELDAESVHCVVTSVPYWQLRDYEAEGQIGLEDQPDCLGWATGDVCNECFVCTLVGVFREVWRVLRPDGTVWLNIGDKYANDGKWGGSSEWRGRRSAGHGTRVPRHRVQTGLKGKDLCMLPHRLALALQAAGWWVRQDVVWGKPNCLPESVEDRPSRTHEFVFLLTRSERYFYDNEAIREPLATSTSSTWGTDRRPAKRDRTAEQKSLIKATNFGRGAQKRKPRLDSEGKPIGGNRRSVWWVSTEPYKGAHVAVMPTKVVEPCILAGTSEHGACADCGAPYARVVERERLDSSDVAHSSKFAAPSAAGTVYRRTKLARAAHGYHDNPFPAPKTLGWKRTCDCETDAIVPCTVLDPFAGSGTTLLVAARLGRSAIGVELNPQSAEEARRRIVADAPLLNIEERLA